MKENELYNLVISKWGITSQVNMLIEEMAELTKVLLHDRRNSKFVTNEEIVEELVDVDIMLSQIKTLFSKELFNEIKEMKLKRLEKRLEE